MKIKVPTLSATGWLTEISERADQLMANYFTSEFSQSHIYAGSITSLPYHIQEYGNDPALLESKVTDSLQLYLNRYFDKVELTVDASLSEENESRINLTISATIYDDDYKYSLGREILSANNKIVNIITLNQ